MFTQKRSWLFWSRLAVVLVMLTLTVPPAAAADFEVEVPAEVYGDPGSQAPVPVTLLGEVTADDEVFSFQFELTFDSTVLELQQENVTFGDMFDGWITNINCNQPGSVVINGFSTDPLVGTGTLFTLNFDVTGTAGAESALTFEEFTFNEGTPEVQTHDGHSTAGGGALSPLNWTARDSGTTASLSVVIYAAAQFVAVGRNGIILTSPDGDTWTARDSGTTALLKEITYGGGQFVVVGEQGTILTSPDGVTWTAQDSGVSNPAYADLIGVAYGNGQYVVGSPLFALTSPDGVTWTQHTDPIFVGIAYGTGAAYGAGLFVLPLERTMFTSPDGATWTEQDAETGGEYYDVIYCGEQFIGVGEYGSVATSSDGTNWSAGYDYDRGSLRGVTCGNGRYVAVGTRGTIIASPDGADWTQETSGVTEHLLGVACDDSQFVAVGANGTILSGIPGAQLDFTFTKTVSPTTPAPGEAITYTITFSNTDEITATNVIITDTLSANIIDASYTSSGAALTEILGSRYVWTAPDLYQGQGGVITITGVLTKPLAAGIIPNAATIAVSGTTKTANADLTVENVAPVAAAGVDRRWSLSQTVTLNGHSSADANGDALTYGWTQTGGSPTVTLSDPTAQQPTFTAPGAPAVLTFTLTVTDTHGATSTDETVVNIVETYYFYLMLIMKNFAP